MNVCRKDATNFEHNLKPNDVDLNFERSKELCQHLNESLIPIICAQINYAKKCVHIERLGAGEIEVAKNLYQTILISQVFVFVF